MCELYVNKWNNLDIGLSQVRLLTQKRKSKIKTRLKNDPDFEIHFSECLEKIKVSDFLKGKAGWKVTFDWVIENDNNYVKILEGNYDNANSNIDIMKKFLEA